MNKISYTKKGQVNPGPALGGNIAATSYDTEWLDWNNMSGTNVLAFIKNKLEDAVVDFEYEDQKLKGKNAFGEVVCSAEVSVLKPNYRFDGVSIKNIVINNVAITGSYVDINANSGLSGSLYLDWDLVQIVGSNTVHNASNQVSFEVYATTNGTTDRIGDPITGTGQWTQGRYEDGRDNGMLIDLKPLFDSIEDSAEIVLNARVSMDYEAESGAIETTRANCVANTVINAKRITLTASLNNMLVRSTVINFSISGLDSVEGFEFQWGGIDAPTSRTIALSNTSSFTLDISSYIKDKTLQINLVARIKNKTNTLYSDWVNVDVLYLKSDFENASGANVMIANIPNTVSNCNSATLFKVLTTSKLSGKINIYAYKTDKADTAFTNISASSTNTSYYYKLSRYDLYLFKTITVDLSTAEEQTTKEYFTYLELDTVTTNTNVFLAFVIEPENGLPFVYKTYKGDGNSIKSQSYFLVGITQPANYLALLRTKDAIIDYSQIDLSKLFTLNGRQISLFDSSNLNENIDSTDGIVTDGRYTGFKVSPLGHEPASELERIRQIPYEISPKEATPIIVQTNALGQEVLVESRPINLFKTPISLNQTNGEPLTSKGKFSIELLVKTYNVNDDDDFILGMGNLRLYPHYLRVWHSGLGKDDSDKTVVSSNYIASCANFAKDEITHIMITYDDTYKPSTYEKAIYNDLYKNYSTEAGTFPCLKIYINGTINRCVSVLRLDLVDRNGKFDLQIHPSNSNINIYGFRTYEKCLKEEEILKNKISSIDLLTSKSSFFEDNDLLYSKSDYPTARWNELETLGLAGTISARKVLNIKDEKYNTAAKAKEFQKKNAIIMVVGPLGPLYYGNKKFKDFEQNSIKTHDAALFVKYANEDYASSNGKFIGQYMAHENGYDEYYKSQGSSAKRYGGSYNTLFAKFYFIPDSIQETFAKLVRGELYDASATSSWEAVTDGEETTYKTNVNINFLSEDFARNYMLVWKQEENETKPSYHQTMVDGEPQVYPSAWDDVFKAMGVKTEYELPTEPLKQIGGETSRSKVTKLVGKVNYASSMQSHKEGACDLYALNYPNLADDYMYRRAVKEDVFYYFYIKAEDCANYAKYVANGEKMSSLKFGLFLREVTWNDIDFDHVKFFGFQTWGSAKMDPSTFGMNKKTDLEYLVVEGADNKNANTNFKSPWAAMLIWSDNAAKSANPYYTAIKGKTDPLEYITLRSGLKVDGTPDYFSGLMINDETIMYKKPSSDEIKDGDDAVERGPDAWDIAGNVLKEGETASFSWKGWGKDFTEYDANGLVAGATHSKITPSKKSVSKFAEFANLIYTFDFGNLELLPIEATELKNTSTYQVQNGDEITTVTISTSKKYVATADIDNLETNAGSLSVRIGDILRWDLLIESFVPAGLYYNVPSSGDGKYNPANWQTMNVEDLYSEIYKAATNSPEGSIYDNLVSAAFDNIENYKTNYNSSKNIFGIDDNYTPFTKEGNEFKFINTSFAVGDLANLDNQEAAFNLLRGALADMFKCVVWAFCDVNSFTYHQAAIRFLSGTDNRAKNIYFVILGEAYKKFSKPSRVLEGGQPVANESGFKTEVLDYYELETAPNKMHTSGSRNLITLFQDDLDTIFATDNNGQQSKDYNLVEPIYNNETIANWGDSRSGLWYNFDLVFEDLIKYHLRRIVDWSTNGGAIINPENNLYKSFLTIQKDIIPAVSYNHASEIYYDVMQTVWEDDKFTSYGASLKDSAFDKFNNNLVPNPISLVHGGCYESESLFLKKRIALLASYTGASFSSSETNTTIKPNVDSAGGDATSLGLQMKDISFILDLYPRLVNKTITDNYRPYADPIIDVYGMPSYLYALARLGDKYDATVTLDSSITATDVIDHTDYMKTITFESGVSSLSQIGLNNASEIYYKIPTKVVEGEGGIQTEEMLLPDSAMGINFVKPSTQDTLTYMDKIVKNVEILDAPYSKFESAIVDFSNCLRISKLNLAKSTTTAGKFEQILLPKSNKLTLVTLPSNIDNVVVEYYPKITDFNGTNVFFKFDSDQVNLKYVTIDFRNTWALEFIATYTNANVQNIIFTNLPELIEIDYNTLDKLVGLPNFTFGTNAVVKVDRMDLALKQKVAAVWGNIDDATFKSGNKVHIKYDIIAMSEIEFPLQIEIEKIGNEVIQNGIGYIKVQNPFAFDIISPSGESANNVAVSGNELEITYELTSQITNGAGQSVGIIVEPKTGNVLIPTSLQIQGLEGLVKIKVKAISNVVFEGTSKIAFGVYEPKPGDIAYSDGTFSSYLNRLKIPIGFVWWSKEIFPVDSNDDEKVLDIRIMSNDAITNIIFGPNNMAYYNSDRTLLEKTKELLIDPDFYAGYSSYDDASMLYSGTLRHAVSLANSMLVMGEVITTSTPVPASAPSETNLYCGLYFTLLVYQYVTSKLLSRLDPIIKTYIGNISEQSYENLLSLIKSTYSGITGIESIAWPAYMKTYWYYPAGSDKNNPDIGLGKWYIPSMMEYSYLLSQKIKLIGSSSNSEYDWSHAAYDKNGLNNFFVASTQLLKDPGKSDNNGRGNVFRNLLVNYNTTTVLDYLNSQLENKIAFLGSLSSLRSSTLCCNISQDASNNTAYSYCLVASSYDQSLSGNIPPAWKCGNGVNSWWSTNFSAYMETAATVYPCCRIIKKYDK